jgi:hypothetical protein
MTATTNSITLPPAEILAAAAAQLIDAAAGDASAERAINKALWNLDSGIEIRATAGGFLMPSGTRAGVIHRVSTLHGCGCEAAKAGRTCWHASALAIIEEAQKHTMPALPAMGDRLAAARSARYQEALAEINELF